MELPKRRIAVQREAMKDTTLSEFEVDREELLVFHIDETYMFSEYFEQTDLFGDLEPYYKEDAYRFEVPESEFSEVATQLRDAYYAPTVIDDPEPYCVVKERYTEHADILRNAVLHWQRRGYNFFLMKDVVSVREALELGATRLKETDMVLGL